MTIRPNKRRFAIGFYVLTGWMPWGIDLERDLATRAGGELTKRGKRFPACCGHVLQAGEAEQWIMAGLLAADPTAAKGVERLVAGPALESWVSSAWHALLAKRWA